MRTHRLANNYKTREMTLLTRLANRTTNMAGRSETVKDIAKAFNCPYTSLYIPIRQLQDIGFLKLIRGSGVVKHAPMKDDPLFNELKKSEIF